MQKILLINPALARTQQRVAFLTMVVPAIGAVGAVYWAMAHGVSVASMVVFAVLYLLTTAGLTVGFHRLFTHKAFKPTQTTKAMLAVLGMMAAQGPVLFWVASHRRHHAFSDTKDDCHSPCMHGTSVTGKIKGLWHAHFGWMLKGEITNVPMFAKDLLQDHVVTTLNPLLQPLGNLGPRDSYGDWSNHTRRMGGSYGRAAVGWDVSHFFRASNHMGSELAEPCIRISPLFER